jgi:hypothetical protein
MTTEEQLEKLLSSQLESFRKSMLEVAEETLGNVYSECLPHVLNDTEYNLSNRVQGCLRNLLAGKFERVENDQLMVWVDDGYDFRHLLAFPCYSDMVKPLCDTFKEELKDLRIEQLESEIENLKRMINSRYNY